MKKYMKGKCVGIIETYDVWLTAALGSIGYPVFIKKQKEDSFVKYEILIGDQNYKDINSYYLGQLRVSAYILAGNIEVLSNINPSEPYSIEIPMKKSPKPTSNQDVKKVQEEEPTEEQLRDFYNDHAGGVLGDKDISEIIDDLPI